MRVHTLQVKVWWVISAWLLPNWQSDKFRKITRVAKWGNQVPVNAIPNQVCWNFASTFPYLSLLIHTLWVTACLLATTFHYFSVTWIVLHSGWAAFITMYWFQIMWYVLHLQKLASHWPDLSYVAIFIFQMNLFTLQHTPLYMYRLLGHVFFQKLLWNKVKDSESYTPDVCIRAFFCHQSGNHTV